MTGEDLIDDIVDLINDSSFTRDWIETKLNQGMRAILGRVMLPGLTNGTDIVTTDPSTNEVDLPTDYHSGLYSAVVDGDPIKVYDHVGRGDIHQFSFDNDIGYGELEVVGTRGLKLVYSSIPDIATSITLRYFRKPADITDDSTPIDGVEGYASCEYNLDSALLNFVCSKAYRKLEDGIEGSKVNTNYYNENFEIAIANLISDVAAFRTIPAPEKSSFWI